MENDRLAWKHRALLVVLYACIATLLLSPLASNFEVPNNIDYIWHFAAINQAKIALALGHFPLRVEPTDHHGWLYPVFQFYSPTSYTVAGFIANWFSPFVAYKITLWCALIISGLYMYKLARCLVPSTAAAVLASVVYLTAPYNFILIDHLAAFNETLAVAIIPAVLYYSWQCYDQKRSLTSFLATGVAWYLLITVHIVTFICTAFFAALLFLFVTLWNPQKWKNLFFVGFSFGFGCVLAAWYLVPVVLYSKYMLVSLLFNNPLYFLTHAPSLADLFSITAHYASYIFSTYTLSGQHANQYVDSISKIHPAIGLPILLAAGTCSYIYFTHAASRHQKGLLASLLILFLSAFVLIWTPINFWKWLPQPFLVIQYSYRLMNQLSWIGALLFASMVYWLSHDAIKIREILLSILFVILCSSPWLFLTEKYKFHDLTHLTTTLSEVDGYLLNTHQYPQFVSFIDNIVINSHQHQHDLMLNQIPTIGLPVAMLKTAYAPFISLRGQIDKETLFNHQRLLVTANGATIADYELTPGAFNWTIPLDKNLNALKNIPLQLKFTLLNAQHTLLPELPIDEILVGGFFNPLEVVTAAQTKPYCSQQNQATVCNMDVSAATRLIELPIFYFPKLLHITINGKIVPYVSVLDHEHAIAAVLPQPGKNVIRIEFSGLVWANFLAQTAWQLVLIFYLYIILSAVIARRAKPDSFAL